MFPKQNDCWACQNRAWQGTTYGQTMLENTRLKAKIEDFKREIEDRDKQIEDRNNTIAGLRESLEHYKRLDNHGFHHEYDIGPDCNY